MTAPKFLHPESDRESNAMSALEAKLSEIFAALDSGVPICEMMRSDEEAAGYRVVHPGQAPWLSADDWDASVVVSHNTTHVRLVAILAKRPGNGALRRTIDGIITAGLIPTIVEPTKDMRETCKRWGWRTRRIGQGFESQEIWYPRQRP